MDESQEKEEQQTSEPIIQPIIDPVSYTHLDVYKRQPLSFGMGDWLGFPQRPYMAWAPMD